MVFFTKGRFSIKSINHSVKLNRLQQVFRPLFICGFPRSGTTFFAKLLDGHSKMLLFPEETIFRKWSKMTFESDEAFFDYVLNDTMIKNMNPAYNRTENERTGSGLSDYSGFPFDRFSALFKEQYSASNKTPKEQFEALFLSFFETRKAELNANYPTYFVEKTPSNEARLDDYFKWWPSAKSIYIIRHPLDAIFSHLQKNTALSDPIDDQSFVTELESWLKSYQKYYQWSLKYPKKVFLVRYEGLLNNRQAEMKRVATYLELDFEEILLQTTNLGKSWDGVSSTGKVIKESKQVKQKRWESYFTEEQQVVAHLALSKKLFALKYSAIQNKNYGRKELWRLWRSSAKPFKKTLFNRLLQSILFDPEYQ